MQVQKEMHRKSTYHTIFLPIKLLCNERCFVLLLRRCLTICEHFSQPVDVLPDSISSSLLYILVPYTGALSPSYLLAVANGRWPRMASSAQVYPPSYQAGVETADNVLVLQEDK